MIEYRLYILSNLLEKKDPRYVDRRKCQKSRYSLVLPTSQNIRKEIIAKSGMNTIYRQRANFPHENL